MAGKLKSPKRRSSRSEQAQQLEDIHRNAAGIDIGSREHWVAVPAGRDENPVRPFGSHTGDLHRLTDWLVNCGIDTVAMESTSVYWIPLYEILEAQGLEVLLANAQQVRNVPGRKSDVSDCQWLQRLHTFGLLRGSFRPTEEITALRSLVRHRGKLIQECATYGQRMDKALVLMNVQLHTVLSDIAGKTGMAIIRDIVAGETNPVQLARHRDPRCRAKEREIVAALTGHYRPEQVFLLRQSLAVYDYLHSKIDECDLEIQKFVDQLQLACDEPDRPLPAPRSSKPSANEPNFDLRSPLHRMTGGVDLTQIPGIRPLNALKLISEIGTDMSRWPTAKHFTSWLTLAPCNKVSGGKRISSKTQPSANRAAQVLRIAAYANIRSDNAIGAYYRRLAVRIGKAKAITATARKIAVIVYHMLDSGRPYHEFGATNYNRQQRKRRLYRLKKQADQLGYSLVHDPDSRDINPLVS